MTQEDKGFFDKLGEILNAPLPGTQGTASEQTQPSSPVNDDDSLLERVKDILNTPLPGTPQTETTTPAGQSGQGGTATPQEKTPEVDEDDLDECVGFDGKSLSRRNASGGAAGAPEHCAGLRCRRTQRPSVFHHGLH